MLKGEGKLPRDEADGTPPFELTVSLLVLSTKFLPCHYNNPTQLSAPTDQQVFFLDSSYILSIWQCLIIYISKYNNFHFCLDHQSQFLEEISTEQISGRPGSWRSIEVTLVSKLIHLYTANQADTYLMPKGYSNRVGHHHNLR